MFEKLGTDLWECMFLNGIPSENEEKIATKEIARGLEFLHSRGSYVVLYMKFII